MIAESSIVIKNGLTEGAWLARLVERVTLDTWVEQTAHWCRDCLGGKKKENGLTIFSFVIYAGKSNY